MRNNVEVTTTATKPLYLQHCSKESRDFKHVALQERHPSNPNYPVWVPHPSVRPLTAQPPSTIFTPWRQRGQWGPAWLRLTERAEKDKKKARSSRGIRRELDRLTWQSYLELSLAGLPGLGLDMVWVELKLLLVWCSNFCARIQSSIHTCTCRSEEKERKRRVRAAHNPVQMSWLRGLGGLVSQLFAVWYRNIENPYKNRDCTD